jgi:hypothetical protein
MDEVDDELEFVEAFEVGKLRRIAGANERIETGTNERACSTAKDGLLAKKIGFRLLAKSCLDYAGTRATDSLCPSQRRLLRVPAGILMNCRSDRARHVRVETGDAPWGQDLSVPPR